MVLREKGFVMLQGPPGTGKTTTLMGLLSAQYEYLKKTGDNRKIMICAPSNAAVNHIVKRIRLEGLFNGNGAIVHPNILRVGIVETLDTDIRAVSLD
jgi:CRISPR/Cas system-associated endonuclease/helicase Cas3